jgi:hypothetical protein
MARSKIEVRVSVLNTAEELAWLAEVHGVTSPCVAALLYGNEDAPWRVETYERDSVECAPAVWIQNEAGDLVREPEKQS